MADLFKLSPSRLLWDDVQAFLVQGLPEGERVDYKRELNDRVPESIAAMANTNGGVILVGVDEDPDTKKPVVPPVGISVQHVGGGSLTNLCYSRLQPVFVPPNHFVPSPSDSQRGVLVVRVIPEAAPVPVWAEGKGVLIRMGDQNRPAPLVKAAARAKEIIPAGSSK